MKKNNKFVALTLATMMLFSAGCTTTGSSEEKSTPAPSEENVKSEAPAENSEEPVVDSGKQVIYVNNSTEPGALQPQLAQGTGDSFSLDHMFKGLYSKSVDGTPENALVEEATTSEDGLTWNFKIKEGTKWSNGDTVTANDFVYSWFYGMNPDNAAKYASQFYIIEGAEAYNTNEDPALSEELKAAVQLKAVNDYELEIKLVNPMAYLPDYLSHYVFYPINAAVAEANPDWFLTADNYVSNGPFVLTSYKPKESIIISKNENYYGADHVQIDEINYAIIEDKTTEQQMYEQGELDLVYAALPDVVEKLTAEGNPELTIAPDLATYYYLFNHEKVPFNNAKVRKALSMTIDRNVIVKNVTKGGQTPAYSLTPVNVPDETGMDFVASVGELFTEDTELARTLLAEGLAEEGIDPATWTFELLYNTNDNHKKVAEAIQSMWITKLGVNCTLANAEFQTVLDRRTAGDYDVARAGWIGDYVDPMTFLELFASYSQMNDSSYESEEYDSYINAAFKEADPAARMEILRDAERLLMEDMATAPIYFYTKQILLKPYVKGVYTPINKYPNFEYAYIEGK